MVETGGGREEEEGGVWGGGGEEMTKKRDGRNKTYQSLSRSIFHEIGVGVSILQRVTTLI